MRTQFIFYYILYRVGVVHLHQVFLFSMQCNAHYYYYIALLGLTVTWVEFWLLMSFYSSRYVCVCGALGSAEAIIT